MPKPTVSAIAASCLQYAAGTISLAVYLGGIGSIFFVLGA